MVGSQRLAATYAIASLMSESGWDGMSKVKCAIPGLFSRIFAGLVTNQKQAIPQPTGRCRGDRKSSIW